MRNSQKNRPSETWVSHASLTAWLLAGKGEGGKDWREQDCLRELSGDPMSSRKKKRDE